MKSRKLPKWMGDGNRIAEKGDIMILALDRHGLDMLDLAFLNEAIASSAIEGAKPPRTVGEWDSLLGMIAEQKKTPAK